MENQTLITVDGTKKRVLTEKEINFLDKLNLLDLAQKDVIAELWTEEKKSVFEKKGQDVRVGRGMKLLFMLFTPVMIVTFLFIAFDNEAMFKDAVFGFDYINQFFVTIEKIGVFFLWVMMIVTIIFTSGMINAVNNAKGEEKIKKYLLPTSLKVFKNNNVIVKGYRWALFILMIFCLIVTARPVLLLLYVVASVLMRSESRNRRKKITEFLETVRTKGVEAALEEGEEKEEEPLRETNQRKSKFQERMEQMAKEKEYQRRRNNRY